jgi:hypothetical protein|nr:MAG TPA: hypothetical protein [Caudoviricetes sp.]
MWQKPKTDWSANYVDGEYIGDYFNVEDYNRIKNNLNHLNTLAQILYPKFSIIDMGVDKQVGDYFYADEINVFEHNLYTINAHTVNLNIGETPRFLPDEGIMTFSDLNRLESEILRLYNILQNSYDNRRHLKLRFEQRKVVF